MYTPKVSFKEAVDFKIQSNCFGYKIITLNKDKIKEYYENTLLQLSNTFVFDIGFIKLIESKIITPLPSKRNFFEDKLAITEFENTEYRNNLMINIFNSTNFDDLRTKINSVCYFCDDNKNKYIVDQFAKYKKNNGNLSKKIERIIYDNYDELISMRITNNHITTQLITIDDIYRYINTRINQKTLFLFKFYKFINELKLEELKKIKDSVETRLNEEQIIFNEKAQVLVSAKSNEVSTYYDKIIKNLIQTNEQNVSKINEELDLLKKDKKEKEELELEFINIQKTKGELEKKIEDCIKIIKSYEDKEREEDFEYKLKYDHDLITKIIQDSKDDLLLIKKKEDTLNDDNFNLDINICDILP
jgi:hypothetical protein